MYYSALIGKPVDHSVSSELFALFADFLKLDYGHLKIEVPSADKLENFMECLKKLGFVGINVTLPYKTDIMKFLDSVSEEAGVIGAVNTVAFKNGKSMGYNTDSLGAVCAIEEKLKNISVDDHILVFGAGGAARAIIYELAKKNSHIVVINRTIVKARKISQDFAEFSHVEVLELNDYNVAKAIERFDIIINATSLGMFPNNETSIIRDNVFSELNDLKGKYFFDAVFNPYETKFLLDAQKRGAKTCPGTYMMIYQAIEAFKIWTGMEIEGINPDFLNDELIKTLTSERYDADNGNK